MSIYGTVIFIWTIYDRCVWHKHRHEVLRLERSMQSPVDPSEVNIYRTDK